MTQRLLLVLFALWSNCFSQAQYFSHELNFDIPFGDNYWCNDMILYNGNVVLLHNVEGQGGAPVNFFTTLNYEGDILSTEEMANSDSLAYSQKMSVIDGQLVVPSCILVPPGNVGWCDSIIVKFYNQDFDVVNQVGFDYFNRVTKIIGALDGGFFYVGAFFDQEAEFTLSF